MRNCPKCNEARVKDDGRCHNTDCKAYSNKVLEEDFKDGHKK